jgi:hypothetical protein
MTDVPASLPPSPLKAPFPWPGGKSTIIPDLNARFGEVRNRVDAFCGSASWILGSPPAPVETINDMSGDVVNAYRAIRADPDTVASYCAWPVSEADLTARRIALKTTLPERAARCMADPEWYDARAAGYFLYVLATTIGPHLYDDGPWRAVDGRLTYQPDVGSGAGGAGIGRMLPDIGATGHGTPNRRGVASDRIARMLPAIAAGGDGQLHTRGVVALQDEASIRAYLAAVARRLQRVRIVCGDFRRVLKPNITTAFGTTAVLLDPPYPAALHGVRYGVTDEETVWYEAARWAVDHGDDPLLRIAVCGYWTPETDALFPPSWERMRWVANGGYGNQGDGIGRANRLRECVWFSPHCTHARQETMFPDETW